MTDLITNGQLVTPDSMAGWSKAELHAMSFLARYRNAGTRRSYSIALKQWFRWLSENVGVEPLEATRVHLELFARELEATGRQPATVGTKLIALAGFYKYAVIDGLIVDDPMVHVARPPVQRVSTTLGLSRTEFADFLRAAAEHPPRNHAVVCLLGLNGMRVSEACGIDIDDLDRHEGRRLVKILRKGGRTQLIPLAPRTDWQVQQVLADRTGAGPLFLTREGHRLDRRTVGRFVACIALEAGIRKRITPHSLRHTFVTMSLDAGATERDVAASVGHADTRLVSYYDRARWSIARNTTYNVAAYVEGAM